MLVDSSIGVADGTQAEVVGPTTQLAVDSTNSILGVQQRPATDGAGIKHASPVRLCRPFWMSLLRHIVACVLLRIILTERDREIAGCCVNADGMDYRPPAPEAIQPWPNPARPSLPNENPLKRNDILNLT